MREIPTYVRGDKSTVVYQVDSANTETNGGRLNGFLESNRGELDRDNWLLIGYIPVGLNTSDGLPKSTPCDVLRRLLNGNISKIATESQGGEVRKRLNAAKHYIAYRETIQGPKDLDIDMRRKTRAGRSSHWQIAMCDKPSLNSKQMTQ